MSDDKIRMHNHMGCRGSPYSSHTTVINVGREEKMDLAIIEEMLDAETCQEMRWAIFPWFGNKWNGIEIARGWKRREYRTRRFKPDVGFIAESFMDRHTWKDTLEELLDNSDKDTVVDMFQQYGEIRKCPGCDSAIDPNTSMVSDDGEVVCEICYCEADPIATVHLVLDDETMQVTEYQNPTEFKFGWHRTDPWRGYYEITDPGDWVNVHDDCILAMSHDEQRLAEFDKKVQEFCEENEIELARVFTRTSNCCSSGYDLYAKGEKVDQLKERIKELAEEYR